MGNDTAETHRTQSITAICNVHLLKKLFYFIILASEAKLSEIKTANTSAVDLYHRHVFF